MRPLCHAQILQRGLLAALNSVLWGPHVLWRLLVKTQTMTKLSGFGEGTDLPYLDHITSTAFPPIG